LKAPDKDLSKLAYFDARPYLLKKGKRKQSESRKLREPKPKTAIGVFGDVLGFLLLHMPLHVPFACAVSQTGEHAMKYPSATPQAYLDAIPEERQGQPLPFLGIASQKHFVAVYHMGIYADPKLLQWFTDEYAKRKKSTPGLPALDMGKSCIRFKKPDAIPFDLIGELAGKTTVKQWIALYEKTLKR
jgi:hypothetical protein